VFDSYLTPETEAARKQDQNRLQAFLAIPGPSPLRPFLSRRDPYAGSYGLPRVIRARVA